jgi:hypothetical protein
MNLKLFILQAQSEKARGVFADDNRLPVFVPAISVLSFAEFMVVSCPFL